MFLPGWFENITVYKVYDHMGQFVSNSVAFADLEDNKCYNKLMHISQKPVYLIFYDVSILFNP